MTGRYPPIEPCEHGMLDVGDGQSLYWETCGNPSRSRTAALTSAARRSWPVLIAATDRFASR